MNNTKIRTKIMLEKMFLRSSCIGKIERKFRDDGEHTPVTRVITLSAIRRISSKPRGFWYRVTTIKITNCSKMIRQNHICKTSHQDRSTTSKDRNGTFSHFLFTNGFSTYGLIMNNVVKIDSIRQKKIYFYVLLAFYQLYTCGSGTHGNFLQWLSTIEHVIEIHSRKNR